MTPQEAGALVALLFSTYPQATLERRHAEAYVSGIVDLPKDAAGRAVDRLRRTARWLPTVAEVRDATADVVLGPRRTGEDAYRVALEAVRKFGRYNPPRFTDPHIARALGVFGGWVGFCDSPELDPGGRARFVELYESAARRERADIASGLPLPDTRMAQGRVLRHGRPEVAPGRAEGSVGRSRAGTGGASGIYSAGTDRRQTIDRG